MRTQAEIVERLKAPSDSLFGFGKEVLISVLEWEHAKGFLQPDVTADKWVPLASDEEVKKAALAYLNFAWGKAEDHRGISAGRSVEKMTEFCWLLGHDVQLIEDAGYAQYGAPKLKVAAEFLGAPLPTSTDLINMMNGDSCNPYCDSGCGQ